MFKMSSIWLHIELLNYERAPPFIPPSVRLSFLLTDCEELLLPCLFHQLEQMPIKCRLTSQEIQYRHSLPVYDDCAVPIRTTKKRITPIS